MEAIFFDVQILGYCDLLEMDIDNFLPSFLVRTIHQDVPIKASGRASSAGRGFPLLVAA